MGWIKENLKTIIIVVVVGGVLAFYGGIKVADMPFFCGMLCHEMQPHVDSLKANFHSKKGVICMDCHSEQGFFNHATEHIMALGLLGGHFSKVYLEDEFDLHKNVRGFNKEEMAFKHKSKEEQEKIAKECLKCHPDRLSGSYFMVMPEHKDKMLNENCHRCHEEVAKSGVSNIDEAKKLVTAKAEKPKAMGNVHPLHIGKDIFCTNCHNRVVHSTNPTVHKPAMNTCFMCHKDGGKAPKLDCKECHGGPRNIMAGTGAEDVTGDKGYMAEEECTGCHDENNGLKFSEELCAGCHDNSYLDTLKSWHEEYNSKLTKATEDYNAIKDTFEKAKAESRTNPDLEAKYKKAEYNYLFVSQDGSKGAHNIEFGKAIFADLEKNFGELKEALK